MSPVSTMNPPATTKKPGRYANMFNNFKYSDVNLYLGPTETKLPAHRIVLGAWSPYFDTVLTSEFKETLEREFHFKEYSAHALWRVFQYMYTDGYIVEAAPELVAEGDDLELLKHPRVFAIADMFQIKGLKDLALMEFRAQLSQLWASDTFTDCIREVYGINHHSDQRMRKAVVEVARSHQAELYQQKVFRTVLREIGDFAVNFAGALITGFGSDYEWDEG